MSDPEPSRDLFCGLSQSVADALSLAIYRLSQGNGRAAESAFRHAIGLHVGDTDGDGVAWVPCSACNSTRDL